MIRFSSIASSSRYGSAYLIVGPGPTRVLIDCGVRQRRLEAALAGLGFCPSTLDAVLVTHEHIDHTYCLGLRNPFPARYEIPVYAQTQVWHAQCFAPAPYGRAARGYPRRDLVPGEPVSIGELEFTAFRTPHDVPTLGFVCRVDGCALGLATDLGHVSGEVAGHLAGCTHLILESNHDRGMQLASGRPRSLIARVLGDEGHLSNDQAATALPDLVSGQTRTVLLAHLSLDCNKPELAESAAKENLARTGWRGNLQVAPAGMPSGWLGG
ncbi:MAG: MBL fold metallo-hydrolase [Bacillota bacterium]|nr:MBL fold metallo-hydrolase [Bacillota bacterium]